MKQIEEVFSGRQLLAIIVGRDYVPHATTFVTPPSFGLQLGFVAHPTGGTIAPHLHRPLRRELTGTPELLLVRKGRCQLDLYDDGRNLVTTRELRRGDVLLLVSGAHGFHMQEDTVFLEAKQGPYLGLDEKEML